MDESIDLRQNVTAGDLPLIRRIVEKTGMFRPAEVEIATELIGEFLARGSESGYRFTVAESAGEVVGYACFGPIPCTVASYDLYWIAVHPSQHRRGLGRQILQNVEMRVARDGGTRIYVDTSGRAAYEATRLFYEGMGYDQAAVLPDFYAPGDAKIIYVKSV